MEVDKFALEDAVNRVNDAYKNFFEKRARFPKHASKSKPQGNTYTTHFTNGNIAVIKDASGIPCIKLPKLGLVRFVLPKGTKFKDLVPEFTHILKVTVRREGKRYIASLGLETVIDEIKPVTDFNTGDIIGMDMGLKDFCHYGTKEEKFSVANPRFIKVHEKRLRKLQKALSRKQYDKKAHKGSKNYYKGKDRVAKEHRKIKNQRKDFHHKLSRKIVDRCKVFVCEDLNIRGMIKNRHLSKAIASVGWGQFLMFVKYKMEREGKIFIKADRWLPSSQICSKCGHRNTAVKELKIRAWDCPVCKTHHDRDDNAVDNLILYAEQELQKAA